MNRTCSIETRDDGVRVCSVHGDRLKQRTVEAKSELGGARIYSTLYCPESKQTIPIPTPSVRTAAA
jgi:hypothetical protein